jgi:hypothetical protein
MDQENIQGGSRNRAASTCGFRGAGTTAAARPAFITGRSHDYKEECVNEKVKQFPTQARRSRYANSWGEGHFRFAKSTIGSYLIHALN